MYDVDKSIYSASLSEFNFSTGILKSLLESLSLSLVNAFLKFGGNTVNEFLSLLESKATSLLNGLNDLKFSSTGRLEDNVETGLFLSGSSTFATSSNNYSGSSGLNAISFLEFVLEVDNLLYCEPYELSSDSLNISHVSILFFCY